MDSRVFLVTGGTSGIGKALCVELAKKGHTIVLVGRKNGKQTQNDIIKISNNSNIEFFHTDFSSLGNIRKLASKFQNKYDRLDGLINNAGAYFPNQRLNNKGIELTFQINHLSHFLLTKLLLELIQQSAPSRIINVSSIAHFGGPLNLDKIQGRNSYKGFQAYEHSKLANILFTYELARRLKGTRVSVNTVHPGTVRTRIVRERKIVDKFWRLMPIFDSAKKGTETILFLCLSSEVENITGKYFVSKKIKKSSKESYNISNQKKLWTLSNNLINSY